jgi:hypothetical protein
MEYIDSAKVGKVWRMEHETCEDWNVSFQSI